MNTFQILAILFVVWIFTFLVNIFGVINLFGFGLTLGNATEDFFVKKMSELNGFILNQRSKIKKRLSLNGKFYLEDESISRSFFSFGVASMILPLVMYFILKIGFFQIIFFISFLFFFLNILFHKDLKEKLNKLKND